MSNIMNSKVIERSCTRFPRLAKIGIVASALLESKLDLSNFGGEFSGQELEDMVLSFGEADSLCDGGWILPDGTVLDFRRSMHNNTAVKHSKIFKCFSEDRKHALARLGTPEWLLNADDSVAIDVAVAGGLVRYHLGSWSGDVTAYFSLETPPTSKQIGVLRDIEEEVKKMPCRSFRGMFECFGHHVSYDDQDEFSRRFVNDILRLAK